MAIGQDVLDAIQGSGRTDDAAPAMQPTAAQTKRVSDDALAAVQAASPPPAEEDPGFMRRAWNSITAPATAPVGPAALSPVLQGVAPPQQDREAANAGFSEGFKRFWGTLKEGATAMGPEFGGMGDAATAGDIRQQNVANAAAYNQRWGNDPDAQKGLMLANAGIGLPFAMAAPEAAALLLRGMRLPGTVADIAAGTAGAERGGAGGLLTRGLSRGVAGAEGGAAAGAATADPSQDLGPQVTDAAIDAGLLAPAIGAPLDVGNEAYRRLSGQYIGGRLPGGQLNPTIVERARQAQILQNNGVDVSVGQVGKDPLASTMSTVGGKLPGSGAKPADALQQQQFRQGGMAFMGAPDEPLATDAVMKDNKARIGKDFQQVANSNTVTDTDLMPAFGKITQDLQFADPVTSQRIGLQMRNIVQTMQRNGGQLPGQAYLNLTGSGGTLQAMAGEPGAPGYYGQRVIDALHDGLKAGAPQADQDLLQQARDQTRAWHTIDKARSSDGTFTPDSLYDATQAQSARFGGSSGVIDPYANAGKTVLGTQAAATAPSTSGLAASAALTAKFLAGVGGAGIAAGTAPITLPLNRALQTLMRARGPAAVDTALSGGGAPIGPGLQAVQRAISALTAQSRPQNYPPGQP